MKKLYLIAAAVCVVPTVGYADVQKVVDQATTAAAEAKDRVVGKSKFERFRSAALGKSTLEQTQEELRKNPELFAYYVAGMAAIEYNCFVKTGRWADGFSTYMPSKWYVVTYPAYAAYVYGKTVYNTYKADRPVVELVKFEDARPKKSCRNGTCGHKNH